MTKRKRIQLSDVVITLRDLIIWGTPIIIAIISATYIITVNSLTIGKISDRDKNKKQVSTKVITPPPATDSALILIGSGTVVRFLKSNLPELDTVTNPLLFSGPSLSAVQLLIHKEHEGIPNFSCIALSATQIKKDSLENYVDWAGFQRGNKNKRIVALRIAEDTLNIGLLKPNSPSFVTLKDTIPDSVVYKLVMQCDSSRYSIYSTSELSGTLTEFRRMFKRVNPGFEKIPGYVSCFDASPWTIHEIMKQKKPALFLCSTIYSTDAMGLRYIIDAAGTILTRPLNLYFIVRDIDTRNEHYIVTGASAHFLIKLKNRLTHSTSTASSIAIPVQPDEGIIETDIFHL